MAFIADQSATDSVSDLKQLLGNTATSWPAVLLRLL